MTVMVARMGDGAPGIPLRRTNRSSSLALSAGGRYLTTAGNNDLLIFDLESAMPSDPRRIRIAANTFSAFPRWIGTAGILVAAMQGTGIVTEVPRMIAYIPVDSMKPPRILTDGEVGVGGNYFAAPGGRTFLYSTSNPRGSTVWAAEFLRSAAPPLARVPGVADLPSPPLVPVDTIARFPFSIRHQASTPDGSRFYLGTDSTILLYDARRKSLTSTRIRDAGLMVLSQRADQLAFLRNGSAWSVELDRATGLPAGDPMPLGISPAVAIAFSPDATQIAYVRPGASADIVVRTRASATERVIRSGRFGTLLQWAPDGKSLVAEEIVELGSFAVRIRMGGEIETLSGMAIDARPGLSPDGNRLVVIDSRSGAWFGSLRVSDLRDRTTRAISLAFPYEPTEVTWMSGMRVVAALGSPTGSLLVSADLSAPSTVLSLFRRGGWLFPR
jgi:hypothetical protein